MSEPDDNATESRGERNDPSRDTDRAAISSRTWSRPTKNAPPARRGPYGSWITPGGPGPWWPTHSP